MDVINCAKFTLIDISNGLVSKLCLTIDSGVDKGGRLSGGNAQDLPRLADRRSLFQTIASGSAEVAVYHRNVSRHPPEPGAGTRIHRMMLKTRFYVFYPSIKKHVFMFFMRARF